MKKSKFSEAKVLAILKEAQAGMSVSEISRKYGISSSTFYNWKSKYAGMSPWNMMEHWGVPSLGGFAREDHVFKAIALCAPYTKLVCMGRAPMIPGYLGSNIEGVFKPEKKGELNGHWDELPASVTSFGNNPEEIFAAWELVKAKVGADEMPNIPFGAVAMYGYADKVACGLQQFMAGARKFKLSEITRDDLMAGNRETAAETAIPYMTDALDESARNILNS